MFEHMELDFCLFSFNYLRNKTINKLYLLQYSIMTIVYVLNDISSIYVEFFILIILITFALHLI